MKKRKKKEKEKENEYWACIALEQRHILCSVSIMDLNEAGGREA